MIVSIISSLFGFGQKSRHQLPSNIDEEVSVDGSSPLASHPPSIALTFSNSSSKGSCPFYMTPDTSLKDHNASQDLSFVTAKQTTQTTIVDQRDMKPTKNKASARSSDRRMQLANEPSQRKSSKYSSPISNRKVAGVLRNRMHMPNYTPEGLKPRRSIEEISASLGLRLLDMNSNVPEQICSNNVRTAKKTNVSFSSYHTIYKLSSSCVQQALVLEEEALRDRSETADTTNTSAYNVAKSPHLVIGEARTAVGLLLAQKDTKNDITYDSQNMSNSHVQRDNATPPRNPMSKVRILPPMKREMTNPSYGSYSSLNSPAAVNTGYTSLNANHNHQVANESVSSGEEESMETKSQDWYNEWYQYEKYKDEQERPSRKAQALNDSHLSYNSRHALFETERSDFVRCETPHETGRTGYDFSPLDAGDENDVGDDDPFVVNGTNNSWISDISQNTSSQVDHHRLSPHGMSTFLEMSAQGVYSGTGWGADEGRHASTAETDSKNIQDESFIGNELNFESKHESKRLQKEQLLVQVIRRLSDNLSLVHDVKLMNAGCPIEPLHSRIEVDKEGILTGYSPLSRSRILSALHRTLVTYDPSKAHSEQNLEQYHAMYFIGTLINLAASKGLNNDEGRWKPKGWVRDTIVSELLHPPKEDMDVSTLSEFSVNNESLGASTISTKHSSPRHKAAEGPILSQTISAVSVLLQDISFSLQQYLSTSSPNSLDHLVDTYVQLLRIPRINMTKLMDAFVFSARPSKSKSNIARLREPLPQRTEVTQPFGEWKNVQENDRDQSHKRQQGPLHNRTNAITRTEPDIVEEEVDDRQDADITVSTMESGPSILKKPQNVDEEEPSAELQDSAQPQNGYTDQKQKEEEKKQCDRSGDDIDDSTSIHEGKENDEVPIDGSKEGLQAPQDVLNA